MGKAYAKATVLLRVGPPSALAEFLFSDLVYSRDHH